MTDYEPLTAEEILTAIVLLNKQYGIGEVTTVNDLSSGTNVNGEGTFRRIAFGVEEHVRGYQIVGRTVVALGRQTTVQ